MWILRINLLYFGWPMHNNWSPPPIPWHSMHRDKLLAKYKDFVDFFEGSIFDNHAIEDQKVMRVRRLRGCVIRCSLWGCKVLEYINVNLGKILFCHFIIALCSSLVVCIVYSKIGNNALGKYNPRNLAIITRSLLVQLHQTTSNLCLYNMFFNATKRLHIHKSSTYIFM